MRRALRLLLPFGWMAALWHLSATPALPEAAAWIDLPAWVQNALHVPLYAILGLAWYGALRVAVSSRVAAALAMAVTVSYGVVDEWHQAFVPGREASGLDVLLDAIGAMLAIGGVLALRRWQRRPRARRVAAPPAGAAAALLPESDRG